MFSTPAPYSKGHAFKSRSTDYPGWGFVSSESLQANTGISSTSNRPWPFPSRSSWLRERVSILHYMYNACLVWGYERTLTFYERRWLTTRGMWPPRSPDLNPCIIIWEEALEGWVYVNKPYSLQEMEDYIRGKIADASRLVPRRGPRNIFRRWEVCLEAGSRHFEDLL